MSPRDRRVVLGALVVPLILFGVPALLGHPAIAQDNLIQNFPLRVLVAQQIRSGHLPLLNPLANSGTPLLGGMNAGAFFPLTSLFVLLPPIMAWVLNLVAVYAGATLGVFALLRWHGIRTSASMVPAFVYAYSGAMIGQLVHLGVVQGFALLPWTILALLALGDSVSDAGRLERRLDRLVKLVPGVLALAVLWALACLSGEPRAIAELELVVIVVVPVVMFSRGERSLSSWRLRTTYLVAVAVGSGWGALIGLAQLLPGWRFITQSERSSISYQFFGAGSLPVRWTTMLFDQTILGGNGVLHQPTFFTNYNLAEVTGYVGILALVATFAFLSRCTRRGWRGADRTYLVYVALLFVGLLATWGSYTPLGHVFDQIPLFASTRLQSRNIILVDLAATVFLGWWLERIAQRDFRGAGLRGRRALITFAPAAFTIVLSLAMLFRGNWITQHLGAWNGSIHMATFETPTLLVQLLIGIAIVLLLTLARRRPWLMRGLVVVVGVDVLVFLLFSSTGFVAGRVNVMPSRAEATTLLGGYGRFALVDPSGNHLDEFESLGSPNMNVFTELPSIQGYGSLIESVYANVTASHPLFSLDPCQLANGTFVQLRLASFAVSNDKLATPLSLGSTTSLACLPATRSVTTDRYFGQMLRVRNITIQGNNGARVTRGSISARLLGADGRPIGPVVRQRGESINFFDFAPANLTASGVEIYAPTGALIGSTTVSVAGTTSVTYQLNTPFQQALTGPHWHLSATVGTLSFFRATHVRPIAWFGTNKSSSRITSMKNAGWGDAWIDVRVLHPTVLKRSEAWLAGWRATARNLATGREVSLDVVRTGLIQQVVVPPGTWEVHFHYHAPYLATALAGSTTGVAGWLAGFVVWQRRRRRSGIR